MTDHDLAPAVVRGVGLLLPLAVLVVQCAGRPPSAREIGAAITTTAWVALTLLGVNLLAPRAGWWTFDADGAAWHGIPIDLWLAWSVLWGAVAALAVRGAHPVLVGTALIWVDLGLMPLAAPVVVLGEDWLVGEAVAVLVALIPALALARWTERRAYVTVRAWAQATWAGGLMVVVPLSALGAQPRWPEPVTALGVQLALIVALPGLAAMRELARVGRGTPLPYDPPSRLVVTGPYAYLRNPMQTSVALVWMVLAATWGDARLLLGVVVVLAYGAGLADWHEGAQLRRAFGARWQAYRATVPVWVPMWRPQVLAGEPATLWVAGDCDMCTGVGGWFAVRSPVGLRLRPAAEHPHVLYRLTYEAAGVRASGIDAVCRALGHLNLAWATAGWALSLPLVRQAVQLCADAFGAGPRPSRPESPTHSHRDLLT